MKISITNFGFFFLFYYISAYIYFSYHLHFLLTFNFLMNMKNMNGNYMLQPSPMQTINLLDFIGSELGGLCISGCITTTVFSNCYLGLNLFCKLN
jgi:hypothetical protein